MVVVVITVWRCRLVVGLALMVLIIDGVFPYGDGGVGCCVYTDGIDYWDIGCSMRSSLVWLVGLALMVLIIDGVFSYGDGGVGCCVYTDYGAFYGGYGWFVGLWLG